MEEPREVSEQQQAQEVETVRLALACGETELEKAQIAWRALYFMELNSKAILAHALHYAVCTFKMNTL